MSSYLPMVTPTPRTTSKIFVSIVITFGMVLGFVAIPTQAATSTGVTYVAVVDAGSSGSRIALYEDGAQPGIATKQMVLLRSRRDDVVTVFTDRFTQSE